MAVSIPSTAEQTATNLAKFETKLNQQAPLNDKAFLRVLAAVEAGQFTSLFKFGTDRVLQNLVLTATETDLDKLGLEYNVPRKLAEAAVLTIQLPGTNGTNVPQTVNYVGDFNGETYFPDSDVIVSGGFATSTVTAENAGVAGNLNIGDTLTIDAQIAGVEDTATVTDVQNTGTDDETDDEYRVRVLDVLRAEGGGGNTADYRIWAQEVAGAVRAYPYSGRPIDDPNSPPPNRTVFVEAATSIDPDGLAPQSLLDEVRASITADPETGIARQPFGLTDETLFIKSIIRTSVFVEIRNLDVAANQESQVKSDISIALTAYFLALEPFVDGLDPVFTRNDLITDLTVSNIVQDILSAAGASATGVGFGLAPAAFLSFFVLAPGEKTKLGTVTYV